MAAWYGQTRCITEAVVRLSTVPITIFQGANWTRSLRILPVEIGQIGRIDTLGPQPPSANSACHNITAQSIVFLINQKLILRLSIIGYLVKRRNTFTLQLAFRWEKKQNVNAASQLTLHTKHLPVRVCSWLAWIRKSMHKCLREYK